MASFLDGTGLGYLIGKIKATFVAKSDTTAATSIGIDSAPTANSTNLVTSGGVKTALDAKQNTIDSSHKLSADLISDGTTNKAYTATEKTKLAGIAEGAEVNVQSDWNVTSTSSDAYIKNKPTIPAAQIQADWNQTTTTALDYIKNKPDGEYYMNLISDEFLNYNGITFGSSDGVDASFTMTKDGGSGGENEITLGVDESTYIITINQNSGITLDSNSGESYIKVDGNGVDIHDSLNDHLQFNGEDIAFLSEIQDNVIEAITFNGSAVPITNKTAAITGSSVTFRQW